MDNQPPQHGGSFSGVPTLLSARRDCRGIWRLNHGESVMQMGEGLARTSSQIWGTEFLPAGPKSSSQAAALLTAEPGQGCSLTGEVGRVQICLTWILFAHAQARG